MLWWLLRAVPPAPGRKAFPGVRLLLGLTDPEKMPERTPWWLLLLRMRRSAAAILAFAGPVLNPRPEVRGRRSSCSSTAAGATRRTGRRRMDRAAAALDEAARDGRPAAVVPMPTPPLPGAGAAVARRRRSGPNGSPGSRRRPGRRTAPPGPTLARGADEPFETLWLTDGIGHGGEADARPRAARPRAGDARGAARRRRWR